MWSSHLVGALQPFLKASVKSEDTMESYGIAALPAEKSLGKIVNRIILEKHIANEMVSIEWWD